jgi:hypothetical protein
MPISNSTYGGELEIKADTVLRLFEKVRFIISMENKNYKQISCDEVPNPTRYIITFMHHIDFTLHSW